MYGVHSLLLGRIVCLVMDYMNGYYDMATALDGCGSEVDYGLYSNFRRSSRDTFLSESRAVARRSILSCQPCLQSNRDTYFGTTPTPSFSESIIASFHLSTHKHHRQPSFNPGNPGRCVIRSLPVIHQSCLTSDLKTTVTPLLAELEETIRDYCPDKVFSWILIRTPAVSISEKASRVGRVRGGREWLKWFIEN